MESGFINVAKRRIKTQSNKYDRVYSGYKP